VIDIGFGDSIEPGVQEIDLPVLLDLPKPRLRAYARETVIAEKFQAMVALGHANSRMKDFYDIWLLAKLYDFADDRLPRAIAATFERRKTEIPATVPHALLPEFSRDERKHRQWKAFVRDLATEPPTFETITAEIATLLMPRALVARSIAASH